MILGLSALCAALAAPGCGLYKTRPDPYRGGAPHVRPRTRLPKTRLPVILPSAVPDELDLTTAMALAFRASPSLRAAHNRVEAARARVAQSFAAYFPQAAVGLSARRVFESPDGVSIPGYSPPTRYASYGTSLSLTYVLFDGLARTYRNLGAEAAEGELRAAWEEGRRLLASGVGAAFYAAILARDQLAIAQEDLAFSKRLLDEAEKMRRAGRASETDRLGFALRANQAEAKVVSSASSLAIQRLVLAELMGVTEGVLSASVRFVTTKETDPLKKLDPDALVGRAFARRPDLARAGWGFRRAEAGAKAAMGAFWPMLSASFEAGHQRRDDAHFSSNDLSVSGGLALSWNLFDGGARHAELRARRADAAAARAEVERIRRAVTAQVLQALQSLGTATKTFVLDTRNVDMARRLRDMEKKAYAAGVSTRTALDQAQRDYVVARTRLALAEISRRLARFRLDIAVGDIEVAEK
jgi:outer membrane protein TolC